MSNMDKQKMKIKPALLIASIVVGVLLSRQIELNVNASDIEDIKTIEALIYDIEKTNDELDNLTRLVKEKEKQLELLMDHKNRDSNIIGFLLDDIESNKLFSGFNSMKGPGIEIIMYDNMDSDIIGSDVNDDIIHDIDILNILNDLRVAGAELISVNDQRVVSTTEIKCGGPIIKINGRSLGTPFIIRAIGNQEQMMAAVSAPGTYGDILKNVYKLQFEAELKDDIIIPSYDGIIRFNYAKPVEEGV